MAVRWEAEACDVGFDPHSGAWITRMTSSVCSNINIYYEQPHASADGNRFVYLRSQSADPRLPPGQQLCVADLTMLRVALVDDLICSNWVATSPWSGKVAYLRANGELILLDMDTLEKQILMTHWPLPANAPLWSLSPDMRYLVTAICDADYVFRLIRVDLHSRTHETIYRHAYLHNHIQVNHVNGRGILLQRNRGLRRNDLGQTKREPVEPAGATHVIVGLFTGEEKQVPLGEPWSAPSFGHATWVGDTGKIATPVNTMGNFYATPENPNPSKQHDPRYPQGNLMIAGPGDESPTVFHAPERCFSHASMSRCGRYFVADDFHNGNDGPVQIVVGNIQTGKSRVLVSDCGAHGGGAAASHPHPYFTADNKRVVYNADRYHVCHIHVAQLPEDYLASLN